MRKGEVANEGKIELPWRGFKEGCEIHCGGGSSGSDLT